MTESTDKCCKIEIRVLVLVLLFVQNSGHALLTSYSKNYLEEKYSSTEVVLVSEIIKVVASAVLAAREKSLTDPKTSMITYFLNLLLHGRKVLLLVLLYLICNLLAYFALSNIAPAVYTVLQQLKILTTAGFSVLLLNRTYTTTQWRALLLLIFGCILVVSPSLQTKCSSSTTAATVANEEKEYLMQTIVGILATIVMTLISGFSSAYFEKILKQDASTVWERNFQLAFYSIFFLLAMNSVDYVNSSVSHDGSKGVFFQGWSAVTVLIAVVQAGGGLLVAGSLKYADSILKTLATSISIVLSAVMSYALLDSPLDIIIVIGCFVTILAVINYTFDSTPPGSNV